MTITRAQIFMIGSAFITFVTAVCATLKVVDPTVITQLGAACGIFWAAIGGALTKPSDQVSAVVQRMDEPEVKSQVVPAVAKLEGVEEVNLNSRADLALKDVAAKVENVNAA